MHRIGIDLGGTKIEMIVTKDDSLEVLYRTRVGTVRSSYQRLVDQIADLVHSVRGITTDDLCVGIGAPGFVDPNSGDVGSSNLKILSFKSFQKDLIEKIQVPVRVVNDANCFALSEALHGAGQGYRMVAGIILGTGMGGGIVFDGNIWSGTHGIAGEWGHVTIDPQGPHCYCGRQGCQELFLSGTGIQRIYYEKSGKELGVQKIFESSKRDEDSAAKETLEMFLEIFGQAMANLVMYFDPDVIVLGGGVSNLLVLYDEGLKRSSSCVFNGGQTLHIVQNKLGDSSGVFGAASVAVTPLG